MGACQLPRLFHEAAILLRVKQLWPVILLDVHGCPAFLLYPLFLPNPCLVLILFPVGPESSSDPHSCLAGTDGIAHHFQTPSLDPTGMGIVDFPIPPIVLADPIPNSLVPTA